MIQDAIEILSKGNDLTFPQTEAVMEEIMSGKIATPQIVSFLTKLNEQGETSEELAAAVQVMRRHALKIQTKHRVVLDTCGTGGDRKHTFNISTAAAFIVNGAGIAVAKHGNRSVSSKTGSADVMEALGININMDKEKIEKCLDEIGIAFLFAQNFHPAMKYAMEARKQIGAKTIFNFLGPLSNPAGATHQLVGVYDSAWAHNLAYAFKKLGTKHTMVVCGRDNLDEISTVAETLIYEVRQDKVEEHEISYKYFGFAQADPSDLTGGDADCNAKIIIDILKGAKGPKRDIVLLNAAAAIYVCDKAGSIKEGLALAYESIDSGKAFKKLELLREYSSKS
ncbi:MAG: anthranilate phosphoribosyltransferase [Candidatus Omnitrophica bacterium]|nr:anthranilate phosphoribosyltransferase [Candidatus Omnitrophota bacterium]